MAEQQPTIAELWNEFQGEIKEIDEFLEKVPFPNMKALSVTATSGKTYYPDMFARRRAELLERCKELEDDAAICVTVAEFEVVQEDDQAFIERDMLAITLSGPFAAEPSKLREFAAILNFWAWELEQRAKEVSNG